MRTRSRCTRASSARGPGDPSGHAARVELATDPPPGGCSRAGRRRAAARGARARPSRARATAGRRSSSPERGPSVASERRCNVSIRASTSRWSAGRRSQSLVRSQSTGGATPGATSRSRRWPARASSVGPGRLLGPVEHGDLPGLGQGSADVEVNEARCHPWFLSRRGRTGSHGTDVQYSSVS